MNLYIRLFFILFFASFKNRVSILDDFKINKTVCLNDLDLLLHMNNGRYFTIGDLARIEMLIRAGVWAILKKRKIYAVVAGETAQFRKPLNPFQRYTLATKMLGWDDMFFYIEHRFMCKGSIHALLLIKVRFLTTDKSKITPQDIIRLVEANDLPDINMNSVLENWNHSSDEHWVINKKVVE